MKLLAIIAGSVVIILGGLFVADWYVLGAGPITSMAKARCVDTQAGRTGVVDVPEGSTFEGNPVFTVSRDDAEMVCDAAHQEGRLNFKGGITELSND